MSSNDPLAELLSSYLSGGRERSVEPDGFAQCADPGWSYDGSGRWRATGGRTGGHVGSDVSSRGMPQQGGDSQLGGAQQPGAELGSLLGSLLGGGTPQAQESPMGTQQDAGGMGDVLGAFWAAVCNKARHRHEQRNRTRAAWVTCWVPFWWRYAAKPGIAHGHANRRGRHGRRAGRPFGGGMQGAAPSMGASQGAVGIGDILGAVLGGGSTGIGPVRSLRYRQSLASKLGLPPAIAQAVLAFVLAKVMSGSGGGATGGRAGLVEEGPGCRTFWCRQAVVNVLTNAPWRPRSGRKSWSTHRLDVDTATQEPSTGAHIAGPAMGGRQQHSNSFRVHCEARCLPRAVRGLLLKQSHFAGLRLLRPGAG